MVIAVYTAFVWLACCSVGLLLLPDPIVIIGVTAGIIGGHALRWMLHHGGWRYEPPQQPPARRPRREVARTDGEVVDVDWYMQRGARRPKQIEAPQAKRLEGGEHGRIQ